MGACTNSSHKLESDTASTTAETGQPAHPNQPILMVSETPAGRLHVLDAFTGDVTGIICLTELHPELCASGGNGLDNPCLLFGMHHTERAGIDSLLMSYTLRQPSLPYAPGAIAQFTPQHPVEPDWLITGLHFSDTLTAEQDFSCTDPDTEPLCHLFGNHAAVPGPNGDLLVADTSNSRLLWVDPPTDGSETGTVTAVLSAVNPDWRGDAYINHVQAISHEGSEWVLLTFKGYKNSNLDSFSAGRIVLWDVTDKAAPQRLWSYPENGYVAAVHQAMVQQTPHGMLLLYAHSLGASNHPSDGAGTIGMALFNDDAPPTYLGDGVVSSDQPLGFVREVEWSDTLDALLVTDSGCENAGDSCSRDGAVRTLTLPSLDATTLTGAHSIDHENQVFFTLEEQPFPGPPRLRLPYESDVIPVDELGAPLIDGLLGLCPDM
jgi:hypothetical protein